MSSSYEDCTTGKWAHYDHICTLPIGSYEPDWEDLTPAERQEWETRAGVQGDEVKKAVEKGKAKETGKEVGKAEVRREKKKEKTKEKVTERVTRKRKANEKVKEAEARKKRKESREDQGIEKSNRKLKSVDKEKAIEVEVEEAGKHHQAKENEVEPEVIGREMRKAKVKGVEKRREQAREQAQVFEEEWSQMRRQRRTTFPAESATILGHPPQAATPGFPQLAPKPSFVQSRYPLYMTGNRIQAQPPSRVQGQAQGSAQKSTQTQTQSSSSKYYAPSQTRPYTSPYPTLRTLAPKPLPRLAPKPVPNPTPTPALGSAPRLTFPPPPIHSAFGLLLGRGYGVAHSGSPAPAPAAAAVPRPFLRPGFGDPEPDVSNPASKISWAEYEI